MRPVLAAVLVAGGALRCARTHPPAPVRFVQMKHVATLRKQRNRTPLGLDFRVADAEPE